MKVLFIGSSNYEDGISSLIINQGNSLGKTGIHIDFYGIKGKGMTGYMKNIIPLRKVLKSQNYDIIHAHYGISGMVALLARKKEKVIISFMGSDVIKLKQHRLKYKLANSAEVLLNRFLSRYFYDFVIVKSKEMFDALPHLKNKEIIPNGVDLALFFPIPKDKARSALNLDPVRKIVLFASDSNRPEKNYLLAEKAVRMINDHDIQMIELKNIELQQVRYYYCASDLLLLTSLHEGSPNVIKEAAACNCPIVSTDVGDVSWVVGDTDGCYVSSFDPENVEANIRSALRFSEEKIRTTGRERIIEIGLDDETIAKKILEVYKKTLEKID